MDERAKKQAHKRAKLAKKLGLTVEELENIEGTAKDVMKRLGFSMKTTALRMRRRGLSAEVTAPVSRLRSRQRGLMPCIR